MPLWVELYFVCILAAGIAGTWDNIRVKRPLWYTVIDFFNELFSLVVSAAYWFEGIGQIVAPVAFILFIISVAWLPIEFKTELTAETLKNPELSPTGNIVAATCAILFGLALFAPLYYWGFQFAVLGHSAAAN